MKMIVDNIAQELSKLSPESKEVFMLNAAAYNARLKKLDEQYKEGLVGCKHDTIVVGGHSAFDYMLDRYGLHEIAVSGISPDAEPSTQKIAEIINTMQEQKINYVVFEDITNPRVAPVLAEDAGAKTIALSVGATAKGSFITLMEENLVALKKVLECV